jgi:hypothetical protein
MEAILFFAGIAILILMTICGIHRTGARHDRQASYTKSKASEARNGKTLSARAVRERDYVEWFTRHGARKTA